MFEVKRRNLQAVMDSQHNEQNNMPNDDENITDRENMVYYEITELDPDDFNNTSSTEYSTKYDDVAVSERSVVTESDWDSDSMDISNEVVVDENGKEISLRDLADNCIIDEEAFEKSPFTLIALTPPNQNEAQRKQNIAFDDETEHIGNNGERSYNCSNCNHSYATSAGLGLHMRSCVQRECEGNGEQHQCNECGKVLGSKLGLSQHMKIHFEPFCCKRRFSDENRFDTQFGKHGKAVVIKQFNCLVCFQDFKVVFDSGKVKPRFSCDNCRANYSKSEHDELPQHHDKTKKKAKFKCPRCGREYVLEGFLLRHLKICVG